MKSRIFKRFSYSINNFKMEYPISPSQCRKSPIHELASTQDIVERTVLGPLRFQLVELTTNVWINARMRDELNIQYLPDDFINGAKRALPEFFKILINDLNNNTQNIRKLTTESLANAFFNHHQQIKEKGIKLELRLNSLHSVRKGENWIQLGQKAPSTILHAPIYHEVAPTVFWRHDKSNKLWLFREMNFEYAFNEDQVTKEMIEDSPSISERTELAKGGCRIAIEAAAHVDLTFSLSDGQSNTWKETINRPIVFRFESEHFNNKFVGNWRISDIDNYELSKMFIDK